MSKKRVRLTVATVALWIGAIAMWIRTLGDWENASVSILGHYLGHCPKGCANQPMDHVFMIGLVFLPTVLAIACSVALALLAKKEAQDSTGQDESTGTAPSASS